MGVSGRITSEAPGLSCAKCRYTNLLPIWYLGNVGKVSLRVCFPSLCWLITLQLLQELKIPLFTIFFHFLNRHYFALPTNPGEQFFVFCTLAAWLIAKAGHHFEQPQEYDDPNAIISKILSELRSFVSAECAVFLSAFQT